MRANFVMSGVGTGMRRNLLMTIALILTTGISLFFLGGSILTSMEISKFRTKYEDKLNVSVYLCGSTKNAECTHSVKDAERAQLLAKLDADPRVLATDFISKDQAYLRNKDLLGPEAAKFLTPADFPDAFVLKLKNIRRDYSAVEATYKSQPGVEEVQNQNDSLKAILTIFDSARVGALAFAVLILICAVILMAITIQVAAAQRRNETSIMRLVGASRWMTQLPFVIEAVIAALVGGLIAIPALWLAKWKVLNGIFKTSVQNNVLPDLNSNDILIAGGLSLIMGIVLAMITAYITLRAYVRL
ncbi:MAG: permease-like cell division protein FtsX [Actinomycetota bacterium]